MQMESKWKCSELQKSMNSESFESERSITKEEQEKSTLRERMQDGFEEWLTSDDDSEE